MDVMRWQNQLQIAAGLLPLIDGLYGNHKLSQWEGRYIAKLQRKAEEKHHNNEPARAG